MLTENTALFSHLVLYITNYNVGPLPRSIIVYYNHVSSPYCYYSRPFTSVFITITLMILFPGGNSLSGTMYLLELNFFRVLDIVKDFSLNRPLRI